MSTRAEDLLYLSTAELGRMIHGRRLTSEELTEAYLARIEAISPKLNAFQTVTKELAIWQAREADRAFKRGAYRGPLHGIPYGAKDLLATAGIETSWGTEACRGQVFDHDAAVVTKLREAGAVLLGKCAMVEFAGGLGYRFADASISGPGRNPWNTDRWTGGSSSGSGAAVAAGLAGFAIGTETWGSILCPAAFCGVTGLRPTYGRVSRAGAMALSWTFDKIGPLARTAGDCRLIMEAIAGHDPADPQSSDVDAAFGGRDATPISKLRGALVTADFTVKGAEPEVEQAFGTAVEELRGLGLSLDEVKLPELPASEIAGMIISAEALSAFENFYRDGRIEKLKDAYARYQPEIWEAMTGADLTKAWRIRRALQERMAEFFTRYDVIVTPNFLSVASPIDQDLYEALPYPDPVGAIGNACGLPAIALPCGFGQEGLPIGFQVVGAPYDEATLVAVAEAYQSRTTWHLQRPPV